MALKWLRPQRWEELASMAVFDGPRPIETGPGRRCRALLSRDQLTRRFADWFMQQPPCEGLTAGWPNSLPLVLEAVAAFAGSRRTSPATKRASRSLLRRSHGR